MGIQPTMPNRKRCSWTLEEDAQVVDAVSNYKADFSGALRFCRIRELLPDLNKNSKQIRARWLNHLSPEIKSSIVLKEDEETVMDLCRKYPGDWQRISRKSFSVFGGRGYTDNAIKNLFHRKGGRRFRKVDDKKESIEDDRLVTAKRKFSSDDISSTGVVGKKSRLDKISLVIKEIQGFSEESLSQDGREAYKQSFLTKEEEGFLFYSFASGKGIGYFMEEILPK